MLGIVSLWSHLLAAALYGALAIFQFLFVWNDLLVTLVITFMALRVERGRAWL